MHVPKDLAVWIPASRHEQVIKDLQHYYLARPCCRRVCNCSDCFKFPNQRCNHHSLSYIPPCQCTGKTCWPLIMPPPLLNKQGREDLERKMDFQLKELQSFQQTQVPLSSDSDDEDNADEKQRSSRSEMVSRSINTDISCLKKPYTQLEFKPAWRYWKSGSPEPQHKQPGNEKYVQYIF